MPSYTRTMQARSKPRMRHHSDGCWYCYRNHYTARGIYLGRVTGAGATAEQAFADLAALERQDIERESAPPQRVRYA